MPLNDSVFGSGRGGRQGHRLTAHESGHVRARVIESGHVSARVIPARVPAWVEVGHAWSNAHGASC